MHGETSVTDSMEAEERIAGDWLQSLKPDTDGSENQ